MTFSARLAADAAAVQAHLSTVLATKGNQPVHDAMRYALTGGKGLRGFLVLESARLHDIAPQNALSAAAAMEALHAYSLIHDDLPCMDDDDLRRGQPTVHRKWDEAVAVLAGDALQTLAFELLCDPALGPEQVRKRWAWPFRLPTTSWMCRATLPKRASGLARMKRQARQPLCLCWA